MRITSGDITYKVVFSGLLLPGMTEQEARLSLAETYLLAPMEAAAVQFDGQGSVLYKSNSRAVAFEANQRLNNAGLLCHVRKETCHSHRSDRIAGENKKYALLLAAACAIALVAVLLI